MEEQIRGQLEAKRYREAFELLLDAFQHKVVRLAYSILGEQSLAEDTAQEVFIRVWKALPAFRGESSLSTWIYTITRNTSITAARRNVAARTVSLAQPAVMAAAESVAAHPPTPDPVPDVATLLRRLPEHYRRVLALYYLEGRSYQDMADMLGTSIGTIKTYMHRARKELAARVRGKR